MKYMGSKLWMLGNGLGHILVERAHHADRFVDLFSGTAAVSWHVAENAPIPVLAVDLQAYSRVLAMSVLSRTRPLDHTILGPEWLDRAIALRTLHPLWQSAVLVDPRSVTRRDVEAARSLCARGCGLVTKSYGGYYFSPEQAITADALMTTLPARDPERSVCLASLIAAMTRCVASPGHTAQPFQPTDTALPFIRESWSKGMVDVSRSLLREFAGRAAKVQGSALVGDAVRVAGHEVGRGDLVFLDPPYSAAQYSRFYHVLETVARGSCGDVTGAGRYPPPAERPKSLFSMRGKASQALCELFSILGRSGCEVVMTFPQHGCSNGIVGEEVVGMAREWFSVDVTAVRTRHSTLGGNNAARTSQRSALELILCLRPLRAARSVPEVATTGARRAASAAGATVGAQSLAP